MAALLLHLAGHEACSALGMISKLDCVCLASLLATLACQHAASTNTAEKYRRTDAGYVLVLRQGDDALAQVEAFARAEQLRGATFTGLGFGHATFGYFNRDTRAYEPRELRDVELASLTGSIAWQDGQPSIHAHGVVTDRTFAAHGGHLLRFEVGTGSLELHVTDTKTPLVRLRDQVLGANVLAFGD